MRNWKLITIFLLTVSAFTRAWALDRINAAPDFQVTERGAHHSVWSKTVEEQLPDGKVVNRTHSYTELASGLNYWSEEQSAWLPSTEDVEIINGAAVARHGAMQVIWTANPNVA